MLGMEKARSFLCFVVLHRVLQSSAKLMKASSRSSLEVMSMPLSNDASADQYLRRYPRVVSHIICESLGYATPQLAAMILRDAKLGRENWCEWLYSCYSRDPRRAVRDAIRNRHHHRGYMADYRTAWHIVRRAIDDNQHPLFASWF